MRLLQTLHIGGRITAMMLLFSTAAQASTIGLSPLFPGGVDNKAIQSVHQLLEAELEFAPNIEKTVALEVRPPVLGPKCVQSTACLAGVSKAAGTDLFLGGVLRSNGANYTLELTLYDVNANTIVRRNKWEVPREATELSNAITPILVEILTGRDPNAEEAAGPSVSDFEASPIDDEEEMDFDPDQLILPPEPAPKAEEPVAVDPFANISFGGSAGDIQSEDLSIVQFGPGPTASDASTTEVADAASGVVLEETTQPIVSPNGVTDLDSPEPNPKKQRNKQKQRNPSAGLSADHLVQVTVRGGYVPYYTLNFAAAGLEVALPVADRFDVLLGLDSYMVRRELTPDLQATTGVLSTWESILPLNAGALYRLPLSGIELYAGADLIAAPYYTDDIGADWTFGSRARLGGDVFFGERFGLNIDAAIGFWSGRTWRLIEQGVGNTGLLPRFAAGFVVRI